jgi:hypothetical protein
MVKKLVIMVMMTAAWSSLSLLHSQPVVSMHASRLGVLDQRYIAVDIEFWNRHQDTIVTYLQNWRAIGIEDSAEVFGFPYVPRLINRLFILPSGGELKSHTSRIEDNSSGRLMHNNLKFIGPGQRFHFVVLLQDSMAAEPHSTRDQLIFYGNYARYTEVRRELSKLPLGKVLFRRDTFIVPGLPVDRGRSWNTAYVNLEEMVDDAAPFAPDLEDLFAGMEGKFTIVSKRIFF